MTGGELVFAALGGLGEIGMNLALYGFGSKKGRKWLIVDCGVSFAGDDAPGCDLILPDISFIEKEKHNLVGMVITHAHEDHIGALSYLWPNLRCPVYMTAFAAALVQARQLSEPWAPKIPITVIPQKGNFACGPFGIETIPVAHSIPESMSLAIRTSLGTVVHTGDWKIDQTPILGLPTDEERFREIGDEGVIALICDSTNVMRDGISPSEEEVHSTLREIILSSKGRVAVTTFASNVSRMRAVAMAAKEAGREVVLVGRAMDRVATIAEELGMLDSDFKFRSPERYLSIPRDKCVLLLTGSQGEIRAALAKIAANDHPEVALSPKDSVIFSSRTIPGNEKAVAKIVNQLVQQGINILTDKDALVHVSGHPRQGELSQMYQWVRPAVLIPAHGEALHLKRHKEFAKKNGIDQVVIALNGELVQLAPQKTRIIDKIPCGKIYKDGDLLISSDDKAISERRKLSFSGIATVAVSIDDRGILGIPDIELIGIPKYDDEGEEMRLLVREWVEDTYETLPKSKQKDANAVRIAMQKSIKSGFLDVWGKKPITKVFVM